MVDAQRTTGIDGAIDTLTESMTASGDFAAAPMVTWNQDESVALITAPLSVEADSQAAYGVIEDLRSEMVPEATWTPPMTAIAT